FGRNGQPGTWRESLSLDDPQLATFANRHLLRLLKKLSAGELTGWRLRLANRMIKKAQVRADRLRAAELALTVKGKLRPDNVSEQLVGTIAEGRLGEAARAVQEADRRLAAALNDFAESGGLRGAGLPARLAELEQVCSNVCAAEHALVTAQRAFRAELARVRPRVLTLPSAQAADPGTQVGADVEAERTFALTRAAVARAREQIKAGDLAGAIATVAGIGQDAIDVAGALPGEWGAAQWTAVEAQHLVSMLQRIVLTRLHVDPNHFKGVLDNPAFLNRLEALVVTLPAETATKAARAVAAQEREVRELLARLEAGVTQHGGEGTEANADLQGVADAELRHQLGRLIGSNVPEQVIADLVRLAERGSLSAEELRQLIAVGRWTGHAAPAGAIGTFAAKHGLSWTKSTKRRLLAALREL